MAVIADRRIALSFTQLASMLDAGLLVGRAVEGLARQGDPLGRAAARLLAGEVLSSALLAEGLVDATSSAVLAAAETSGTLPEHLRELARRAEARDRLRRQILGGLAYPFFVVHLGFLLPSLGTLVSGGPAAYAAEVLPFLLGFWGILCGAGVAWWALGRTEPARRSRDGLVLRLPFLGSTTRDLALMDLLFTLGALYRAGVPILRAMEMTRETLRNAAVRQALAPAAEKLAAGVPLGRVLAQAHLTSFEVESLLETGEQAGSLGEALSAATRYLEERNERSLAFLAGFVAWGAYALAVAYVAWRVISFYGRLYRIE